MSLGIYPEFDPPIQGANFNVTGEALAAILDELETIATAAKLTAISEFGDDRPLPDDFDGDPEELEELMGEWNEWFNPAVGRAAMLALAERIKQNPKAAKQLDDARVVLVELDELARLLAIAVQNGSQFRLHLG